MDTNKLHFLVICLCTQIKYLSVLWHLGVQERPLVQEHHLSLANQELLGGLLGLQDQAAQEFQGNHVGTGNAHNFEFFHSEVRLVAGLKNKDPPDV